MKWTVYKTIMSIFSTANNGSMKSVDQHYFFMMENAGCSVIAQFNDDNNLRCPKSHYLALNLCLICMKIYGSLDSGQLYHHLSN